MTKSTILMLSEKLDEENSEYEYFDESLLAEVFDKSDESSNQ